MQMNRKSLFYILPAFIFISNELIRTYIRPEYGKKKYGLLSEILGWLPNFLAGFGIIAFAVGIVVFIEELNGKKFGQKAKIIGLFFTTLVAGTGLIIHEISQKSGGLYYDIDDIFATIVGIAFGIILYYFALLRKNKNDSKQIQ